MPDMFDQASDLETREREAATSMARSRLSGGPGPEWIDGRPHCRECGEEIPAARINALPNCSLCRDCQQEMENN